MTEPHLSGKLDIRQADHELGHVSDYFPMRNYKLRRWLTLTAGVLAIVTAIGLMINFFVSLTNAIQTHGRAMVLGGFPVPFVIYAAVLIGGIVLVLLAKIHWWNSITLFKNGLIKDKGNCIQVWFYEDTDRFDNYVTQIIFGGSIIGGQAKILLEDKSSRRLVIRDDYNRMEDLIQSLRSKVLPPLLQRARQQLVNGQVHQFHKNLSATAIGVEINDEVRPYHAIQVDIKNGTITIHQIDNPDGQLFKARITRIRNLDLFLDLLENPPTTTDQLSPR